MRKRFASKSAFFNPSVLVGCFLCLLGALVALIALTMYSSPSALAQKPREDAADAGEAETVPIVGPVSQTQDLRTLPYIAAEKEQEEQRLVRYPRTQSQGVPDPLREVKKILQPLA